MKLHLVTRLCTFIQIGLLFIACSNDGGTSELSLAKQLDAVLKKHQGTIAVPGTTAAVYNPNGEDWTGVSGNSYGTVPLTPEMRMGIGSNTKTMTSAIVLKLEEQNKLKLSDAISKYLPNMTNVNGAITIEQLLQHSSGLDEYFEDTLVPQLKNNPNKAWTPQEIIATIGPPDFSPGQKIEYSNTNYVLLGMIIEKITGKPYSNALKDLFKQLGLNNTYVEGFETVKGTMAHPWALGEDWSTIPRTAIGTISYAAGCVVSTPKDIVKWYKELFGGYLTQQSIDKMSNFKTSPKLELGLGLIEFNGKYWGHGGGTIGYSSVFLYNPSKKFAVAVIVNDALEGSINFPQPITIAVDLAKVMEK